MKRLLALVLLGWRQFRRYPPDPRDVFWAVVAVLTWVLYWLAMTGCGDMSFSAGPIACQFRGEYLITLYATTEGCVDLEQRRTFHGEYALWCKPSLALPGYSGTVQCLDDSRNIAQSCDGQLQGEGCEYELVVERVTHEQETD